MKLSVQSHIMKNNANYTLIQKTNFKGGKLTSKAFAAEAEILENIKTLPKNVFLEQEEFLKFCKTIDITPKISSAIKKRLAEVRQVMVCSSNIQKSFIESSKRIIEGYEWLLNNGRQLLSDEIAEVTKIAFDVKLSPDIRNNAKKLLKKQCKIR